MSELFSPLLVSVLDHIGSKCCMGMQEILPSLFSLEMI